MLPTENEGSHLFVPLLALVILCFHDHNYFNQEQDEISKWFKFVFIEDIFTCLLAMSCPLRTVCSDS